MWRPCALLAALVTHTFSSAFLLRMAFTSSPPVRFVSHECMAVLESQLRLAQSTCNTKSIGLYVHSEAQISDSLQLIVSSGDHQADPVQGFNSGDVVAFSLDDSGSAMLISSHGSAPSHPSRADAQAPRPDQIGVLVAHIDKDFTLQHEQVLSQLAHGTSRVLLWEQRSQLQNTQIRRLGKAVSAHEQLLQGLRADACSALVTLSTMLKMLRKRVARTEGDDIDVEIVDNCQTQAAALLEMVSGQSFYSQTGEAGISAVESGVLSEADLWQPEKSEHDFQIDGDVGVDIAAGVGVDGGGKEEVDVTDEDDWEGHFDGEAAGESDESGDYWDAS